MTIFSYSLDDIRRFTAPLCPPQRLREKEANLRRVERAFERGAERCAGRPVQLHVEPSADCTLACPRCPRGAGLIGRHGLLELTTFLTVLDELAGPLAGIVFSGWGEPLLNPATPAMVRATTAAGVASVVNTNGTPLAGCVEALLEASPTRVTVALDGAARSGCHRYSGAAPFAAVVRGLAALRERKERLSLTRPRITGLFVIDEADAGELGRLRSWALSAGAEEVQFKRMHREMPGEGPRRQVQAGDRLARALATEGAVSSERLDWTPARCAHPWESLFLAAGGELAVCSFDPHLRAVLGHVRDGVAELWNGERLRALRRAHSPGGPPLGEPCAACNRLPGYFVPPVSSADARTQGGGSAARAAS